MRENLMLRQAPGSENHADFLDSQGFIEIETPILTKSSPEGARIICSQPVHQGNFFALPSISRYSNNC